MSTYKYLNQITKSGMIVNYMSQSTAKNYKRSLKIPRNYSFFLFGPRGVGKTTLLDKALPQEKTLKINLLDHETRFELQTDRAAFKNILRTLKKNIEWVYIDEIQKVPALLDEIHHSLETNRQVRFALIGSSARKLKAGRANLLAGRAFALHLYPLSFREIGADFDLDQALQFGTLPKVFEFNDLADKKRFLATYVDTYLKEEVIAEGVTRNLPAFRNFLHVAAVSNGEILSFKNIAQDVGTGAHNISSYYEILEDTLLGFKLQPYHRSIRKKQRGKPKFYFFDPGVVRALQRLSSLELKPQTIEYGRAFEHFIINELIKENSYRQTDFIFSYFATPSSEVDLIIEKPNKETILIEIKSNNRIRPRHLTTLKLLLPSIPNSRGMVVSREQYKKKIADNLIICPWQEVINEVFGYADTFD